jgi:hypothetical protein
MVTMAHELCCCEMVGICTHDVYHDEHRSTFNCLDGSSVSEVTTEYTLMASLLSSLIDYLRMSAYMYQR